LDPLVWRVLPLGVPAWPECCSRCAAPELESTSRFRVNANGVLHDVWLLYRCPSCGLPRGVPRRASATRICVLARCENRAALSLRRALGRLPRARARMLAREGRRGVAARSAHGRSCGATSRRRAWRRSPARLARL